MHRLGPPACGNAVRAHNVIRGRRSSPRMVPIAQIAEQTQDAKNYVVLMYDARCAHKRPDVMDDRFQPARQPGGAAVAPVKPPFAL